jgi:DeoR family transcriptional regulator, aga operon transcriptional repressor
VRVDRYSRWAALLELLSHEERVTVEAAADRLDVSRATIRRDFDALARQRKLVRLRGAALHDASLAAAAVPTTGQSRTGVFEGATAVAGPPHARRIAGQAAALVRGGSVVGLTGAALRVQLARAIGVRFETSKTVAELAATPPASGAVPALTVVTNDLGLAADLARRQGLKVVAAGGVLSPTSMTLTGPLAALLLQGISLDTALVAADAVDPDFGVTAADEVDGESCALMIGRAHQVVVAVGSGELDRRAFARVCGAERIDVLVTDAGIAPATAERFAKRGVRIVIA